MEPMTYNPSTGWRRRLRIIWAIATKDILEAIKNKSTLMVILSALFVVGVYRLMPVLTSSDIPAVLVYDAGRSQISKVLEDSQAVDVYTYPSYQRFENALMSGESAELGLVIPAGYDEQLSQDNAQPLQTYLMYFVRPEQAQELIETTEAEIQRLSGQAVSLAKDFQSVTPTPERNSLGMWGAMSIIFAILMVGLSLIPHLFMEEKQRKTLDALLVSPANASEIVIAKAIAGAFYGLLIGGIILGFYWNLLIHPGMVFLGMGLMVGLTVAIGLVLGILIENRGQLSLVTWMLVIPLFLSVILVLMDELMPKIVLQIAQFIPTLTIFRISQAAFGDPFEMGQILLWAAYVILWIIGLLVVCALLVKRLNQGEQRRSARAWFGKAPAARPGRDEPVLAGTLPDQAKLAASTLGANGQAAAASPPSGWKIVASIAGKDISEALHNKLALSIILGALFMVAFNSALPRFLFGRALPTLILIDPGNAQALENLPISEEFRLQVVDNQAEMTQILGLGSPSTIGVALPADLDQRLAQDEEITLEAFAIHWMRVADVNRLADYFGEMLSQTAGVKITIQGAPAQAVFPPSSGGGQSFMFTQLLVYVLLMLGMILAPLLMVEEKEAHTLEILRVSPATTSQILSGKALAGGFYGLLAGVIMLAINGYMVANWGVALLALFSAILFSVAVGLLIGVVSNNATTTSAWGGLVLLVLILLTLVSSFVPDAWPGWLQTGLTLQPGGAIVNLFESALQGDVSALAVMGQVAGILVISIALLWIAGWRFNLQYRKA